MIAEWENRKFVLTEMKMGFMVRDKDNPTNFVFFTVEEIESMLSSYNQQKRSMKK